MEKQKIFITFSLDVHKKIDIVDKIEKEIKVKNCKICKQDKKLSEYYKNKNGYMGYGSYCKTCTKQKYLQRYFDDPKKYKQRKKQYMKQWYQDNPNYMKQWYQDNPNYMEKFFNSIPPGIYGIYENTQLIYIGESVTPYRRIAIHFSNTTNPDHPSLIAQAIGNGKLQRENLSFKILDYIDDNNARRQRESVLIQRYRPKYNTLYVNA